MRIIEGAVVALVALMNCPVAALAQDDKCPQRMGLSNDDCDEWHFERLDKLLTEAVAARIDANAKLTTNPALMEEIKQAGQEAHRAWIVFREAECKAAAAANVMSARTKRGKNVSCLLSITKRRLAEVTTP